MKENVNEEVSKVAVNVNANGKIDNNLKEKIILFAIGILVGGLIVTGAFFTYLKATSFNNCNGQNIQANDNFLHDMPHRQGGDMDKHSKNSVEGGKIEEKNSNNNQQNN